MGVPDRGATYENCDPVHRPWSLSSPSASLTTTMPQQQQHQHHYGQPPPPYPGHSKHVFSNEPGFRQSYSGSDTSTDMSLSSTENLAAWPRQDPQGEETRRPTHPSLDHTHYNVPTRLHGASPLTVDSPSGSLERLASSSGFVSSGSSGCVSSGSSSLSSGYGLGSSSLSSSSGHYTCGSGTSTSSGGSDQSSGNVKHHLTVSHPWQVTHGLPPPQSGRYFRSLTPTYHHPHPYVNQDWMVGDGDVENGENVKVLSFVPYLPPPPQYPGKKDGGRPCERKIGQGRCLSDPVRSMDDCEVWRTLPEKKNHGNDRGGSDSGSYASVDTLFSALKSGLLRSPGSSQSNANHVIDVMSEENRRLQSELLQCYHKISKLQKVEQEIQQVHEAYKSLVRSTDKRERLETAIKNKLQAEVKNLQTQNEELKAQVQKVGFMKKQRSRSESRSRSAQQKERDNVSTLKQTLNEKQSRIEQLEAEIEQWEQKHAELQASLRLEQSLASSWCAHKTSEANERCEESRQRSEEEKEARSNSHKHDLALSQNRIAQLETEVQWLQLQLAEKDKTLSSMNQSASPSSHSSKSCLHSPRSDSSHGDSPHQSPHNGCSSHLESSHQNPQQNAHVLQSSHQNPQQNAHILQSSHQNPQQNTHVLQSSHQNPHSVVHSPHHLQPPHNSTHSDSPHQDSLSTHCSPTLSSDRKSIDPSSQAPTVSVPQKLGGANTMLLWQV